MRRMTRKSYKRKRILLGLALFVSVAFIATGFAAWVLSTDATANQNGNVSVGTVTDSSLAITLESDPNQSFSFDAAKNDNNGRLQWDGTNFENLSVNVKGVVGGVSYCKSLTIQLIVEDATQKAALDAAIAAGYIAAPACYNAPISIYDELEVGNTAGLEDTFDVDVAFTWGTKFGNVNPSLYFDDAGATVDDATMENELAAFYKMIMVGSDDYKTGSGSNLGSAIQFKILIVASASV